MPSPSKSERKSKLCLAIKEFSDELLNVVKIKMEKINTANDQQVIEVIKMDKLYDKIQKFEEPIKNLEILLAKNNVEHSFTEEEIELIETTKEKVS